MKQTRISLSRSFLAPDFVRVLDRVFAQIRELLEIGFGTSFSAPHFHHRQVQNRSASDSPSLTHRLRARRVALARTFAVDQLTALIFAATSGAFVGK